MTTTPPNPSANTHPPGLTTGQMPVAEGLMPPAVQPSQSWDAVLKKLPPQAGII